MYRNSMIFALALTAALCCSAVSYGKKLHLIIACDTYDTSANGDISGSTRGDELNVINKFKQFFPPESLSINNISNGTFTEADIMNAIRNANVNYDDTIMFYYSGHGDYDYDNGTQRFTLLNERGNIPRYKVVDALRNKNARLTICMTDCCNVIRSETTQKRRRINKGGNSDGIDALFFNARGVVDITSSRISEVSLALKDCSLFTICVIDFLEENKSNPDVKWLDLNEKVQPKMSEIFKAAMSQSGQSGIDLTSYLTEGAKDAMDVQKLDSVQRDQRMYFYQCPGMGVRFGVALEYENDGVVVVEVINNSPAQKAGIKQGDVITEINGKSVETLRDADILIDHSPQYMRVKINSNGSNEYKTIRLTF